MFTKQKKKLRKIACPECFEPFMGQVGLSTHMRRAHGLPRAEEPRKERKHATRKRRSVAADLPEVRLVDLAIPAASLAKRLEPGGPKGFDFGEFSSALTLCRSSIPAAVEHLRAERQELQQRLVAVDHQIGELERLAEVVKVTPATITT